MGSVFGDFMINQAVKKDQQIADLKQQVSDLKEEIDKLRRGRGGKR
jgi:hypothetical protein